MEIQASDAVESSGNIWSEMDSMPVEQVESLEAPVRQEEVEEPQQEEQQQQEEEVVETPPAKSAQPVQKETPVVEKTEVEQLREQLARTQQELTRVSAGYLSMPKEQAKPVEAKLEDISYVEADDKIPELFTSAKGMNALFNRIRADAVRDAMQYVPALAAPVAAQSAQEAVSVMTFWNSNNDLLPYRDYVAGLATQIQVANPNATFDQITSTAAQYARQQLGIQRQTTAQPQQQRVVQQQPPRQAQQKIVPPTTGARPSAPVKLVGIEKELAELDSMFAHRG